MVYSRTKKSTVLDRLESRRPADEPLESDMIVDLPATPLPAQPTEPAKPNRSKLSTFEKELLDAWAEE